MRVLPPRQHRIRRNPPDTPDTPETPDTPNPGKPSTGDTMNLTLWVVVAIASCAAIPAVVVVCRRRTSR